ncbi:MAG: rhodanese-like domain-containing protein [Candidatus Peribacteraceae bacterium]
MSAFRITAFYHFQALTEQQVQDLRKTLFDFGMEHNMRGLVLLATEGINGTVCGTPDVIEQWKQLLRSYFPEINWKDSEASELVFPRWFVKIRAQIVGMREGNAMPGREHSHISPEEWNKMMEEEDVVVIDARNVYETKIGMFDGAVDPKIRSFDEFATYVATCNIPKDKKVLMYCTGGIRCERAIYEMEKQGYSHVYQLKGGILEYLKQCPNQKYKGECFVFDHRIAVDQELQPSKKYDACPHCGDPGELTVHCKECDSACRICDVCSKEEEKNTCSKNCRYWLTHPERAPKKSLARK